MGQTASDVNELPPRFVEAISSEVIIVDNQFEVARVIPCPQNPARVPGLHAGSMDVAADFDAPLPDDFSTGAALSQQISMENDYGT